jgi:hypothetical protein
MEVLKGLAHTQGLSKECFKKLSFYACKNVSESVGGLDCSIQQFMCKNMNKNQE